ncbi:filament-like plant protein 4 [Cinnamomum micranthum f. kanehirae]|uniref:Filament-like plant protein 4 n=1 Tax=Cinnamomum micranthum f. kanehirae TaxID=337451 RepID=A0A3S3QAH5_9MAGN|nr:filament-like plant protein 4 [Cinnamomum micranthum f. kanehirae]
MDRRSWPWKKKTSEKVVTTTETAGSSLASSAGNPVDQDNSKNVNYVQISTESYAHFTELEDQVKLLNEKLSSLNEKLSAAQSEMINKDNLVKQHAKVAEEAVSGWEKAEAEALALKNHLESVTLLKLTAEDRASHLDGALKECMRQIRNVKEENEQKLHDTVLTKTKQWEKVKIDLDAKIAELEQDLLRSSAENTALSRSLQERSNMLFKISEEKSQADAEIEVLKTEIQSCEKEISSLKYELHIVSKELEIRNEEKNMSLRSAEVVNKQNLEGVKKIAKLEAECQRLRSLVRKKLPGPAALAQMKLEVENLGQDYGEPKLRRSPGKASSPHLAPATEFSRENIQQYHKEMEFLTARLLTMEEETKMLKEALSRRNSELQASRNMCAKISSKLHSLEAQIQLMNQSKGSLNSNMQNMQVPIEGSLSNTSNPPSVTSMSEDGVDEEVSCADSWATAFMSELPHFKKEKNIDKVNKVDNSNRLELMDDFLEMERLACLSADSNGTISLSGNMTDNRIEHAHTNLLVGVSKDKDIQKEETDLDTSGSLVFSNEEASHVEFESDKNIVTLAKLQSRIAFVFESEAKDSDIGKILADMKHVVQDLQDALPQHSVSRSADVATIKKPVPEDQEEIMDNSISLIHESDSFVGAKHPFNQELSKAISVIHVFVLSLGKEATEIHNRLPDAQGLSQKIEMFSVSVNNVLFGEMHLVDFVLGLSHVLAEASQLSLSMLADKQNEGESNVSDCIDKVTLLENIGVQHDLLKERFSSKCDHISQSASDPEILQESRFGPSLEQKSATFKSSKEELEQLKIEKDKMAADLARCTEGLEHTKNQLEETEQLLAELKSELAASQKSNSLAETQLKCMAESYRSLEMHAQGVEKEMNLLRAKAEALDTELQEEKHNLQDALARCKDLEEQIQRNERCATSLHSSSVDGDIKNKQEKEIAAAAEKLAECQETIFLLGRQLKALHPSSVDHMGSPYNERLRTNEDFFENTPSPGHLNPTGMYSLQDLDQTGMENGAPVVHRIAGESPLEGFLAPMSSSDTEGSLIPRSPISSKKPKHRSTRSASSMSSSGPTPEKNARSLSRFFSRGKGVH